MNIAEEIEQIETLLKQAYQGRISNLQHSLLLASEALKRSKALENKALIGKSLNQLALYHMVTGEYEQCISFAKEAASNFEQINDERGVAEAKYNIAGVYYRTDNYHLGLVHMIDCRTIYLKYDDYHNLSRVEKSIGTIYEYFGDQKNAQKSYESAITAAQTVGDLNLESNAYNPLSGIFIKQGRIDDALLMIERSISLKKQTGDVRGLAFAIYGRGKVYTEMGRFEEAEADYIEAGRIHLEMGDRLGLGMVYYKMGVLYYRWNNNNKAKEILQQGINFSAQYNTVLIKIKCSYLLYLICKQENNIQAALEYLEHYLKEKETVINTQTLKVIENYELITKMELLEKEARAQREKAEIIEKKNRAEESARIKQEFLSTMSHEIRTPLNAVITITALLAEKTNPEEKQLMDSLRFASNNLLRIINDILDYTKLDLGKVSLDYRPLDFGRWLRDIKNTYDSLAKEKKLTLDLKIDAACAESYELDETKAGQILGNLISNAIKFTETGGVTLEVKCLKQLKTHDVIRFNIIDTGVGIPAKVREEIFESFSQPKSITTKKHGGSGLGLAIVKKLIALHNSDVFLESTVGEGTVFYFDLKLKKAKATNTTVESQAQVLGSKTVLLAEDNKVNAMVAIRLLKNWGLETEHAENGLLVVEKAKQKRFDYILMDIHMPEMNGYDAAKKIRTSKGENTNTPIFALTADVTAENEEEYTKYFDGFLRKPIEINKLYDALAKTR
ncbi:MAG: tetratricopeptide repeat protein [Bacteroidetes bacterium]|nr:MAG: tetratricopeptide repeat protein [Bacteroidota bacterium]